MWNGVCAPQMLHQSRWRLRCGSTPCAAPACSGVALCHSKLPSERCAAWWQAGAELTCAPPGKKDAIKILAGEQRGQTGQLLGVDHSDGIVKLDANLDIKILALEHLARLHDPARPPDVA